jgi:hypothetical protein
MGVVIMYELVTLRNPHEIDLSCVPLLTLGRHSLMLMGTKLV